MNRRLKKLHRSRERFNRSYRASFAEPKLIPLTPTIQSDLQRAI